MAGRCKRAAFVAKLKEQASGGGKRHNLSPSGAPVLEIEIKCMRDLCRDALEERRVEDAADVAVGQRETLNLNPQPSTSTPNPHPSPLNSQPSQPSPLSPQPSTLNPQPT
jgi:hypothetical protein